MNLNEIPSYLKNSEAYKILVSKGVRAIKCNNIPYEINLKDLSFDDFKNILRCCYFWKLDLKYYPIEFYIYIHYHQKETKIYLKKYANDIAKTLLNCSDLTFLEDIISVYDNYDLLEYIIQNQFNTITVTFNILLIKNNLKIIKHFLTNHSEKLKNLNLYLEFAFDRKNLELAKLFLKHGANVNWNYDRLLLLSVQKQHLDAVIFLLDHGANIHNNYETIFNYAVNNVNIFNLLLEHSMKINKL